MRRIIWRDGNERAMRTLGLRVEVSLKDWHEIEVIVTEARRKSGGLLPGMATGYDS